MLSYENKKEFRQAYLKYYPFVFSAVYSKTGNREDAEDICHEVFIRFMENFMKIQKRSGWLRKAVTFEIGNYYGKKAYKVDDRADIDDYKNHSLHAVENCFQDTRMVIRDVIENEENFTSDIEMVLFELVSIYGFTLKEAAGYLKMTRWQAQYMYKKTTERILQALRKKGIKGLEDLL